MENDSTFANEEEVPKSHSFAAVCTVLLLLALGFLMYRVATQPRQSAGVPGCHVAPPGTFFAREYVTITRSNGIIGLPPGTAVFVRQKGSGHWVVNDGIDDLTVNPTSLTVDVELAAKLRARDAEAQNRAAASQARAEQIFQQTELKRRLRDQAAMDDARHRMAGDPVGGATRLDESPTAQAGSDGVNAVNNGSSYYNYQTQQWVTSPR